MFRPEFEQASWWKKCLLLAGLPFDISWLDARGYIRGDLRGRGRDDRGYDRGDLRGRGRDARGYVRGDLRGRDDRGYDGGCVRGCVRDDHDDDAHVLGVRENVRDGGCAQPQHHHGRHYPKHLSP